MAAPQDKSNRTPGKPGDLNRLLNEAVRHSVQLERELLEIPDRPPRRTGALVAVLCALLLAASGASFVLKPEFIWGKRIASLPPQRSEANARLAMFLLARRLDLHHSREGEYPESLADVGGDVAIGYRLIDGGTFELSWQVNGKRLVLSSTDDRDAFLGNSVELVQQRVSP
ncbi:MAG TPA: hypothetical protein VFO66_10780 [Gemmatimonadaceae bacterium]|nr:hypothetical protein [Gemmatimonadaceae bacterium]